MCVIGRMSKETGRFVARSLFLGVCVFHLYYILSFFRINGLYIDVAVFGKKCYTMHEIHKKK